MTGRWFSKLLMLLTGAAPAAVAQGLPPAEDGAVARLNASPRHGEWVKYDAGGGDSVTAWVVYPERSDPAPVVVVIHEIYGLTDRIQSVRPKISWITTTTGARSLRSG